MVSQPTPWLNESPSGSRMSCSLRMPSVRVAVLLPEPLPAGVYVNVKLYSGCAP